MPENPSPKTLSVKFYDIAAKTNFFQTVERNGWRIKFSVYRDTFILMTVVSKITGQTIIRYFNSEPESCRFISYITELDPSQEYMP